MHINLCQKCSCAFEALSDVYYVCCCYKHFMLISLLFVFIWKCHSLISNKNVWSFESAFYSVKDSFGSVWHPFFNSISVMFSRAAHLTTVLGKYILFIKPYPLNMFLIQVHTKYTIWITLDAPSVTFTYTSATPQDYPLLPKTIR